jgi:hypothetical protein
MFDRTINELKNSGLTEQDDVSIVVWNNTTMGFLLFGAIGSAFGFILFGIIVGSAIGFSSLGVMGSVFGFFLFGAIGNAIIKSGGKHHIMALNNTRLRVFEVNAKTGEYLGNCLTFRRDEITNIVLRNSLASFGIGLRTTSGNYKYSTFFKTGDYEQKEQVEAFYALVKSVFGKK